MEQGFVDVALEKGPAWTLLIHSYLHFFFLLFDYPMNILLHASKIQVHCSYQSFIYWAPTDIRGAMLHPESADSVSPGSPLQSGSHPQSPS